MEEVTEVLVSGDSVLEVGYVRVFRLVLVEEFLPFLLEAANLFGQVLEEVQVVVTKLVLREGNNIEPNFLVHPVVFLVAVINTSASLKESTDVSTCEDASLDLNLESHHQLECDLVSLEKSSVYVSIHLASQCLNDILNTVLDKLGLLRVGNGVVEEAKELGK